MTIFLALIALAGWWQVIRYNRRWRALAFELMKERDRIRRTINTLEHEKSILQRQLQAAVHWRDEQ